jgi:hypothetical protein
MKNWRVKQLKSKQSTRLDPKESRNSIAQAISRRYAVPAHEVE